MSNSARSSSVCAVFSTASHLVDQRTGVFLSPDLVLTTYHNGQNLPQITFQNDQGDAAISAHLKPVAESRNLGMALVELNQPIGKKFARIPQGGYSRFVIGSLATAFSDKAESYKVAWDTGYDRYCVFRNKSGSISMSNNLTFSPENAGAPIFREDGETLATMVSDFRDSEDTLNYLGMVDLLEKENGRIVDSQKTLLAVNPNFFHRWLQENATVLNLV